MFPNIKEVIHKIVMHECDDIIVELMREKLDISVRREGSQIIFTVHFAGELIKEDRIDIP